MAKASHLSSLMLLSSQLLTKGRFNEGLPSFLIKNVDAEQIWQQLELRNDHKFGLPACTKEIVSIQRRKIRKNKDSSKNLKSDQKEDDQVSSDNSEEHSDSSDSDVEGNLDSIKKRLAADDMDSDEMGDFGDSEEEDDLDFDFQVEKELAKGLSDDNEDSGGGSDSDTGAKASSKKKPKKQLKRTTVVDDKFFKMADMEEFLDAEDLKEEKRIRKEKNAEESDASSDEEDEEIDMFADDSEDEDDVSLKLI